MKAHALLIVAACGLIAANAAQDDVAERDTKELQGTWKTVASEVEGQKVEAFGTTTRVVIKGDQYIVEYPPSESGEEKVSVMTFTVDANKKPKAIDFASTTDPGGGKLSKGIYELEGDTLKICFNPEKGGDRPTEFATKAGSRVRCITLKREKR
jgi:uncharacterized protein (TIGR03067 family)